MMLGSHKELVQLQEAGKKVNPNSAASDQALSSLAWGSIDEEGGEWARRTDAKAS